MRVFAVILLQVILAVMVSGLVLPAVLFAVPEARTTGPFALVLLASVVFLLLRLAWPRRSGQ